MASLINSIRNVTSDSSWLIKIAVFSGILFAVLYESYYIQDEQSILIIYSAVALIFLGCASFSIKRNINNEYPILPNLFSIPEVLIKTIGSAIAIVPGFLLYYICITFFQRNWELEANVTAIVYILITIFFVPFIFVPVVLYSVRGKLTDAFNLKSIFAASGNFTVQFLSYVLQYILIMCTSVLVVYYTLLYMLGDHVSLLILKSIFIVISFFSIFLFFSDLYGDVIPEIKVKHKSSVRGKEERHKKALKRKIS